MSAVERLEHRGDETPPRRDVAPVEVSAIEAQLTQATAARSARLRPLLALGPYVARYRGRAVLALISLTIAAITTLIVPVAVRRMIDFGFTPEGIALINSYFSVMIAVVAVLALASASRFYLVMTIGERIVADLRRDVFSHLMSLSPAFFDSARSGELISRLTADTTQIKSAVGASVSIALRNFMLFIGATAMMVITSPRLSGFVLLAIPVIVLPLVAFGRWVRRLSRNAQDTLADATAYASELVGAIRTVQAYTSERLANARFGGEVEQAYEAARSSTRARAVLTAIIIFIVFTSVVAILWIGSHDVLTGAITPGRLGQFVLYAAFAAAGLGQLQGRRNGCLRSFGSNRRYPPRPRRARCRCRSAATSPSTMSASPIRPGRTPWRSMAFRLTCAPARRSRLSARLAPARARCFICCCGSTIRSAV
jgi:ATP-binding cassette subfamily B protein